MHARDSVESTKVNLDESGRFRELILPGEMRGSLDKLIEAKKAAEAGVITRREEAAALRHQANAAKLYTDNPTLLRLRELEAVEKIAAAGRLNVVLGDKGLAEKIVNRIDGK